MQYTICRQGKKSCPCRILDLESGYFRCKFPEDYTNLIRAEEDEKAKDLLGKFCEDIRNYELHQDQIATETKKNTIKFLKDVKIGDIVFCQTELDDVILLEKPSPSDYYGYCKYQKRNGEIRERCAVHFIKISRGNYYAEYIVEGSGKKTRAKDLEYLARSSGFRVEIIQQESMYLLKNLWGSKKKARAKDLEYLVRSSGFRVEIIQQESTYLLKIFGDSQQKVDDFVTLVCQNDFMVY